MNQLHVTFRILTPLFLSGADQQNVELRIPSVKGVLRYWYRAMDPGYNQRISDNANIAYEQDLFGGPHQSRIWIRKDESDLTAKILEKQMKELSYLTFFVRERAYFTSNQNLRLRFLLRHSKESDSFDRDWKSLLASVWLMGHLGGLGARSRRGFGSITLQSWRIKGKDQEQTKKIQSYLQELPLLKHAKDQRQWLDLFITGIRTIRRWFPIQKHQKKTMLDQLSDCFLSNEERSSWIKALKGGQKCIQAFRKNKSMQGLVLGLPTKKKELTYIPKDSLYDRVASPIWLRIIPIREKYVPLFAVFELDFPEIIEKETQDAIEFCSKEAYQKWKKFLIEWKNPRFIWKELSSNV